MSFSEEELQQHCETIMNSRRAQGKIVVLCEGGNLAILKQKPRPSPTAYRQQEKIPDANFYKACIPTWWTQGKPQFFVCGDRENVINTYFKLLELHPQASNNSYIKTGRLFAIIDLDLQPPKKLNNYPISDTEALFKTLYQKNTPQLENLKQNHIFITGLIYKEAYFLIPELQCVFDDYLHTICYKNNSLNLENLYQIMAGSLSTDKNLQENFNIASSRINYIEMLDFTSLSNLQNSFLKVFENGSDDEKKQLIYALLSIQKIKQYWKDLSLNENESSNERFKEQLTLQIGQFYSQQPQGSQHHLPSFFNALLTAA